MPLPAILTLCLQSLTPLAVTASPTVRVASFGVPDTLFLVVLALIVFGPKKLPEISRQIGKLLYEFRKASNDFKFQIEEELRASEQAERQKQLAAQTAAPQPATPVAIAAGETVSAETASVETPTENLDGQAAETSPEPAIATLNAPNPAEANPASPTDQSASGESAKEESGAAPVIQPPASGLPVSGRSPYRAIENAEGATAVTAAGDALDEMQADAQEAVRAAAADPSYSSPGETDTSAGPVPTHHG